jgi:pSer/pThr/pTyr-binding forkhead associated (FHA) protein
MCVIAANQQIGKSSLTIGRDKANYISVSGGAVSRTHCRLEWDKKGAL